MSKLDVAQIAQGLLNSLLLTIAHTQAHKALLVYMDLGKCTQVPQMVN
jgi:hypothetical protein